MAVVIVTWPSTKLWRSHLALNRYLRHLTLQGEKLTREALPSSTDSKARQAGLEISVALLRIIPIGNRADLPSAMRAISPGLAVPAETPGPIEPSGQRTNDWSLARALVASSQEPLLAAHKAVQASSQLDFGVQADDPLNLPLNHLQPLRDLGRHLALSGLLQLHGRDSGAAVNDLLTLLAIINGIAGEPRVFSHQMRAAMTTSALALTWDLAQSPIVAPDHLAEVQNAWSKVQFLAPLEATFERERIANRSIYERARKDPGQRRFAFWSFMQMPAGSRTPPTFTSTTAATVSGMAEQTSAMLERSGQLTFLWAMESLWSMFWSYDDERHGLEESQAWLQAIRAAKRGVPFASALKDVQALERNRYALGVAAPLKWFFSMQLAIPPRAVERIMVAHTTRDLAAIALALRRFQFREGRWPRDLRELVPGFLPAPPIDPWDGKPLRYRLDPEGRPILYSVGPDGVDQGGDATAAEGVAPAYYSLWRGRDLVWPRPATPDEVAEAAKPKSKKR